MKKAKQAIVNLCTLQYFNSDDQITIQVDASSIGVSAALMQQGKVVPYHSRALNLTQQHYSNIERECYGLVNGVEHFHHYVFGHKFIVQTGHQPLVQLMTKPLFEVSPRLQRLLLKVTKYKFNTIYVKHDGVPVADCLSCNVQAESALEDETISVTIAAISMFQEGKINQIKCKTSKDLTLVKLAKVVQTRWPDQHAEVDQDLHAFWIHRWHLSIVDGVIMNGTRIVIPKMLQNEYLRCLHTGHFGISKCRPRAKSTVYWPGIDKDITNLIGHCDTCRQVQQYTPPTFEQHSVEACYPSHIFGSHIANIDGKPHVVIVDYYSFFMYERPMLDMSSETLILALKTIFSESDVPNIFITHTMKGSTVPRSLSNLAWNGPSYTKHHHLTIQRETYAE